MESLIDPPVHLSNARFGLPGSLQVIGDRPVAYPAALYTPQKRCHTKDTIIVGIVPLPIPCCPPQHHTATFARHTGTVFFIARNPMAGTGNVAATVVHPHLLYNQGMLVANMRVEVLINMTKS
ncbi:MAG TPA: hypothetical protein VEG43_00375 [Dehalococcoidia bacterium]|nr:hypothetical protein [Dehalococcoidia bacterium]